MLAVRLSMGCGGLAAASGRCDEGGADPPLRLPPRRRGSLAAMMRSTKLLRSCNGRSTASARRPWTRATWPRERCTNRAQS
ncbi:hypothetical protein GQ55_6G179600 [Panicum hallii var. hallii]|uniref:Uncharacterized protein n=1 Tax=Panicum hallii var. hallii TaxID=1504633 RepID=A0A2T7D753_9POAL|nr:hypothetical protein GQ55_6G179600 [Panicum hallii var. hallii]